MKKNLKYGHPVWLTGLLEKEFPEDHRNGLRWEDAGEDHARTYRGKVAIWQPYYAKIDLGRLLVGFEKHGIKVDISGTSPYFSGRTISIIIYRREDDAIFRELLHDIRSTAPQTPGAESMIAGISCGFNPLGTGRDFSGAGLGDPLIDFNEDHQFSISIPVKTDGKNFGKHKLKTVWFNSVRCANLALLELRRKESRDEVVSYDYNCQSLGEYRAAQGYKRCPTCKKIHKLTTPFCDDVCKDKYQGDIATVLEVADVLNEKPMQATVELRGRCASPSCGQGRDERGNRVRARVPERGDFCSKECRVKVREAKKQVIRQAERQSEAVEAVA